LPAETSVTIPDCTIVIDSAREKQSSYDPTNRMPLLIEHFASKASLKQRRGRAGRVREGTCYKLISRATYGKLRDHGEPEIQRCALDQTLLSLLFLGVERGSGTFMSTLLDPPSKESLQAASSSLCKVGAVEPDPDGQAGDLRLTPLGVHLAGIPAPPIVGKMLVMGSILGCRTPALAMAAGLTLGRSPFLRIDTRRKKRNNDEDDQVSMEEMKQERILEERSTLFKTVGHSDHALLAAVYMQWQDSGSGLRKRFCESLGLSFNGLRDMQQLVNQMDGSLRAAGYTGSAESDSHSHSWRIIRACAVSSMAPSQLVKVRRPPVKYQETAEGAQEKDGESRGLKFFVRIDTESSSTNEMSRAQEERVFIHPSSANFTTGSYNCPWLVYHSLVRTSKAFLRDVTECSAYALLLFGGELEVQAASGVILVDGWAQLSANARIGSLIGGLRKKVDELLTKKVADPSFELANTLEMNLIVKLIRTDGLGT
jgi:ATP-dependent RNA helicase DHX57